MEDEVGTQLKVTLVFIRKPGYTFMITVKHMGKLQFVLANLSSLNVNQAYLKNSRLQPTAH